MRNVLVCCFCQRVLTDYMDVCKILKMVHALGQKKITPPHGCYPSHQGGESQVHQHQVTSPCPLPRVTARQHVNPGQETQQEEGAEEE